MSKRFITVAFATLVILFIHCLSDVYGESLRRGAVNDEKKEKGAADSEEDRLASTIISGDGSVLAKVAKKQQQRLNDTIQAGIDSAEVAAVIWRYLGLEGAKEMEETDGHPLLYNINDLQEELLNMGKDQTQGEGGGGGGGDNGDGRRGFRGRIASNLAEMLVGHSRYPFCAWDASADESIYTPLLLDPNAVYQPQLLSFAAYPKRIYKIKARYPKVIYFSYQSYTLRGKPLTSLTDRNILPHYGKNPYREVGTTPETSGGYEIHITRHGDRGLPNELRGLPADSTDGGQMSFMSTARFLGNLSIIMLRFYTRKPPSAPWGLVDPPVITYSDDDGKTWETLEQCSTNSRELFNRAMRQIGTVAYGIQDLATLSQRYRLRTCALVEVEETFDPAFVISATTTDTNAIGYIPFANYDSDYSYWCTDGDELGPDFVMVMTGKVPITATGLYDEPLPVPNATAYEVRYWSLAAAELHAPRPTFSSISGYMMEKHYGEGWDHRYRVVAARDRELVKICGLDSDESMFLTFSNKNVRSPPVFPAIIAREQLARHIALNTTVEKGTMDYIVEECHVAKKCLDPNYLKQELGDRVPTLQVFKCDVKTGIATPYTYMPTRRDRIGEFAEN